MADERNAVLGLEDQLVGVAVLHHVAIDKAADPEIVGIEVWLILGDYVRAKREKCVHGLS